MNRLSRTCHIFIIFSPHHNLPLTTSSRGVSNVDCDNSMTKFINQSGSSYRLAQIKLRFRLSTESFPSLAIFLMASTVQVMTMVIVFFIFFLTRTKSVCCWNIPSPPFTKMLLTTTISNFSFFTWHRHRLRRHHRIVSKSINMNTWLNGLFPNTH